MKFSVAAVAAFATFAAAANTSLTPEQQCASQCATTDICCKAICFNVPCPSNQDAKDTTQCAAKCPTDQGVAAYARCQQGCIQSHFYTSGGTPTAATSAPTSGSNTATTTGSSPSNTSGSESSGSGPEETSGSGSSPSATESGSGSSPSQTGAAVSNAKFQLGSAAGVVGLLAAAFAL